MASASRPPVATSSPVETTALLNGSGLTLTTARVVALAPWLSNAPPPPSRKAMTCQAGSDESTSASASSAPPSGRMMLWTVSQIESTQAILSARNSAMVPTTATPSTQGLARTCSAARCSGSGSQAKCIAPPVARMVRQSRQPTRRLRLPATPKISTIPNALLPAADPPCMLHPQRCARNGEMTRRCGGVIAFNMSQDVPPSVPPAAAAAVLPDGAIPAATLVIMRPPERGTSDEILMVKRSTTMAFAAGAVVFPGGRVDPDDYLVARPHGFAADEADGAARVAALRETLEETGLAVGWPTLADDEVAAVRQALLGGTLLSDILAARGDERIALESLVPFARWCPNFKEARTFDTRFYAVAAPPHSHELTVEEAEHSHIFWASAQDTLAKIGRAHV